MDLNQNNLNDGTELRARGAWNDIKGQAKQKWANLTDDDLTYQAGQQDQWFGRLQQKTGETIDSIKNWFNDVTHVDNSTELQARGNWNDIKGQAKQKWGNLTDDDLTYQAGQQDEWFGNLQKKTGETIDDIKGWFSRNF